MGLRLRKSINLGLGFRINLSKSGIGYSWGFPGYRITKMANGGNRTTYSLPGTGISYVEQSSNNSKNYNSDNSLFIGDTEEFKNIPIEELEKNDPILKEINKVCLINKISNIFLIMTFLVYYNPIFLLSFLLGIIMKIFIYTSMKVKLYYDFDDDGRKMYTSLKEVLIILSNSKRIWQINTSTRVFNTKYNAGAGQNVSRSNVFVTSKLPWFIKTNINIYGLNLKNQKMFFTPDRVIVFKKFGKVFGCTYNDMYLGINTTRFVESERVYNDAEIVEYTWKYANLDGGRDLRFSKNKRYPVCKYGELTIKSPNGINTLLNFSNHNLSDDIQNYLILFGNQFNKILAIKKGIIEENNITSEKIKSIDKKIKDNSSIAEEIKPENKKNNDLHTKSENNKEYKLPEINILSNEDSKNVIPFIKKMKEEKNLLIPIGECNDDLILEKMNSMPNLLIGGTVMSGKTSYINTIVSCILLTKKPSEVKLLIYDSKKIDYSFYNGIPHLLAPVITNLETFNIALKNICYELENRIKKLKECNIKNISLYNEKVGNDEKYPDIILFVDDFSALNNFDEINNSIEFITSNGWYANIFVIAAANYPSSKVISTISKSNFPARMSFKVASSQASQIIINDVGAEKLNGYGNALYSSRLSDEIKKIKVPYITDNDISRIVEYCCKEQKGIYTLDVIHDKKKTDESDDYNAYEDPLYDEIVDFVIQTGKVSASLIQRKYRLGYNRAAQIIDLLEERGIVGPPNGSNPRIVLVKYKDSE